MFNYVRMSDGGPRRHDGPRSEVEVIATIAEGVLNRKAATVDRGKPGNGTGAIDWPALRSTAAIRQSIAAIVPGFEKLADIDRTREEFQIDGRTFHEPRFATPDGRARLHTHNVPPLAGNGDGELRLMTFRSEGQFNTVVYEDEDVYRGINRRDVVLLHPEDLCRLRLSDGQRVTVHGPAGSMPHIRATSFDAIKPGNAAMYYPEANRLISRDFDPLSKTPAFKCVVVRLDAGT
jgi:anaerobic selenocysteine-containing dehydrogenase